MAKKAGKLTLQLSANGVVTLCVYDNPEVWVKARLIVIERASNARLVGGECLEIPWWDFAPILPHLRSLTLVFPDLVISADKKTEELIRRANSAAFQRENIGTSQEVSEADLLKQLKAVGFGRATKLTKHQIKNVRKLVSLANGATFSVPGAGKTTEALAVYAFKTQMAERLFIVAPKNAFAAWDEQVAACLPGQFVTRLVGGSNIATILKLKPKIVIISYSQLTFVVDIVQRHLAENPSVLVLDESHKIKGGEHKAWANAVLSVSHSALWKLIMSGTPMPNSPDDLIPQIRFLYPEFGTIDDPIAAIQPFFVRTTKADLDLPPITAIGRPVAMTDPQARIYNLCATEIARDADAALTSGDKNLLRGLGKSYMLLLQLVSNPSLLAHYEGRFASEDLAACLQSDSPKIRYVCNRTRQLAAEGHKVIIWSSFVENVEVIAERLSDLGADFIHGDVEAGSEEEEATREHKVARFHKEKRAQVLVANPAACSEGISLHTVCHHAIYLDRNYNAAQFLQSADRIHRLGLPKNQQTYIEFVYSPGTIDDSVKRRLDFKIARMETALKDPSIRLPTHWFADLSELPDEDDLRDLVQTLRANDI